MHRERDICLFVYEYCIYIYIYIYICTQYMPQLLLSSPVLPDGPAGRLRRQSRAGEASCLADSY